MKGTASAWRLRDGFEREVTGERIRDKIAASKKKGMWMGGYPPLGYDVKDRKLLAAIAQNLRKLAKLRPDPSPLLQPA